MVLSFLPEVCADEPWRMIFPEQRHLEIRDPSQMPRAHLPEMPPPATVSRPRKDVRPRQLSLDEAIQIALANSKVIRVLTGEIAVATGRTIYDPAISNTSIDEARGRFDPTFQVQNEFSRLETPYAVAPSYDPNDVRIAGQVAQGYDMRSSITKPMATGGQVGVGVNTNPIRTAPEGLLNPYTTSSTDLTLRQPLLQGAGVPSNLAPIVIARIDTERSFFQMRQGVQQMVRSVIQAYWNLVLSRTEVWARRQQVDQGFEAFNRAEARVQANMGNTAEVAQARASLAGFRAALVTAQATMLDREAALRGMLGWPPSDETPLVPITAPVVARFDPKWNEIVQLAEERRPDLIELKLVLEADHQQIVMAKNQALPQLDAVATYRWNGLEGRTPDQRIINDSGQFADWQIGVNFSVPFGMRTTRSKLRRQELILTRDRANLDEQLLEVSQLLARSYRNVAQYYEQYLAYQETRNASRISLDYQLRNFVLGRKTVIYLDVLQSITQWGNAVNSEAQSLMQYNLELSNLEYETGTILETHGIRFAEERYRSIGPLGRLFSDRCYPKDSRPSANTPRYQTTQQPSEEVFGLDDPLAEPPNENQPSPPPQPPTPPQPPALRQEPR
jgi:outer membrane protein TolC